MLITNMEKYGNYKEQMSRLKKAIANDFLLEALFIEYAIVEDRCESLLLHSGKTVKLRASLSEKLKHIEKLCNKQEYILKKYISLELVQEISSWSKERNDFIHHLMTQSFTHEDLQRLTERGQVIVKTLCSKSTSYKRAVEKRAKEQAEQ